MNFGKTLLAGTAALGITTGAVSANNQLITPHVLYVEQENCSAILGVSIKDKLMDIIYCSNGIKPKGNFESEGVYQGISRGDMVNYVGDTFFQGLKIDEKRDVSHIVGLPDESEFFGRDVKGFYSSSNGNIGIQSSGNYNCIQSSDFGNSLIYCDPNVNVKLIPGVIESSCFDSTDRSNMELTFQAGNIVNISKSGTTTICAVREIKA